MAEAHDVALTLDLKGLACPMPVVRLSQGIKEVEVGTRLEAFATDPGVVVDIPAWCRSTGHELVDMARQQEGVFRFLVRRAK